MGPLDNEGKRLVSVMWQIILPGKARPKFQYRYKTVHICLESMYASPCPFLLYINIIKAKCHLSQYNPVQSPHTIAAIFML